MIFATWGPKQFEVNSSTINTFFDFSTNYKLAEKKDNDDGGKPATNVKGTELRDLSFSIIFADAVGLPAESEIESWFALLEAGEAYDFYMSGKPLSKYKWLLKEISISETNIDNTGRIIQCLAALSFQEFAEEAAKEKKTSKTKAKSSSSSSSSKSSSKSSSSKSSGPDYKNAPKTISAPQESKKEKQQEKRNVISSGGARSFGKSSGGARSF